MSQALHRNVPKGRASKRTVDTSEPEVVMDTSTLFLVAHQTEIGDEAWACDMQSRVRFSLREVHGRASRSSIK